ncbi:DoxX family protein [Chryseobacterium sp. Ch-15]|uniref:DoxX family protein n=1 Tax=Chryseobacterium muglaense TaxID=2893752 RepID=A0A9Q3UZI8_9FLAO|nr:DoxX family protein [Chryseobacterium muglaense]MBD3903319.1 DoxX family protein [Chryseobacterium muglaense]MCC9036149.1 DoxX family protein [Chryseobacterium muglaense]MCM2553276.1 DoxX family protein [Chryseobacterium muglaense]
MKKDKIIFWTSTALVSAMMLFSAFNYLTAPEMKVAFDHLGFPDYFRIELAIAKFLGVLVLLLPFVPKGFKLFAYAGFTINFISAGIAHTAVGDPLQPVIMSVLFLILLIVSWIYYLKLNTK